MTDHQYALHLEQFARAVNWREYDKMAMLRGAAALRQPRLPGRWPLAWVADSDGSSATGPLGCSARALRNGVWRLRRGGGTVIADGKCATAWSARRAAARAVARAVKESMKGDQA